TRQFGTASSELTTAVAVHSSGVYLGGETWGPLADAVVGRSDAFIRKYSLDGTLLWTRQFGDSYMDQASGLAVDASGVHSVGQIYIPPASYPGVVTIDALIQSYDHLGNSTWTQHYGTDCEDYGTDIGVYAGQAYIAGDTHGTLPGETSASNAECSLTEELPYYDGDVWVARFPIPAPATSDAASPQGSVQLAGGRTYSTSTTTTLSLQASDPMPRTGVAGVRVSNDGKTWSGWRSYTTTQSWALSAGDGAKQVRVQFRDASGNLSATVSDGVTLDATAPAVALGRPTFAAGAQVSAGSPATVRTLVRGTVSDSLSGVRRYVLQRSVDGGGYLSLQDVRLAAPTSSKSIARTVDLVVGRSYRFRLVAYDAAGNRTIQTGPSFRVAAYQEVKMTGEDAYGSVSYPAGSWTRQAFSSAYRGYVKGTTGAGRARLSFTGRSVAWVAPTSSTRGRASVCVDSASCVAVDLSGSDLARKVVFVRSWASSGKHTLEIRTQAGRRVDADAFVVLR
ncbi:MAG: hypothetical protein M3328_16670, partial [Chloroflexota bacterium]|nr:hypothetical protein [Chloroflexota bacterium]